MNDKTIHVAMLLVDVASAYILVKRILARLAVVRSSNPTTVVERI